MEQREIIERNIIHPKNLQPLLKTPAFFKVNILGTDAIFDNGIEFPYDKQQAIYLEANSRPYLKTLARLKARGRQKNRRNKSHVYRRYGSYYRFRLL